MIEEQTPRYSEEIDTVNLPHKVANVETPVQARLTNPNDETDIDPVHIDANTGASLFNRLETIARGRKKPEESELHVYRLGGKRTSENEAVYGVELETRFYEPKEGLDSDLILPWPEVDVRMTSQGLGTEDLEMVGGKSRTLEKEYKTTITAASVLRLLERIPNGEDITLDRIQNANYPVNLHPTAAQDELGGELAQSETLDGYFRFYDDGGLGFTLSNEWTSNEGRLEGIVLDARLNYGVPFKKVEPMTETTREIYTADTNPWYTEEIVDG